MRKFIKAAAYIAVSLALFFLLREIFPKYAGPMKVYLILWVLDGYLWVSTASYLRKKGRIVYYAAKLLYWTPFLLIIAGIIYGWFHPFLDWNILLRTEFLNIIQTGYAIKFFPIVARVLNDAVLLTFGPRRNEGTYGRKAPSHRNGFMITGWVLGFALGIVLMAGHVVWQYRFRVEKVDLTLTDLPHSFDRLRIVQISDLHLGNWVCQKKLDELTDRVNRLNPDLIFVTGDMATWSARDVAGFKPSLRRLRAKEGIFVIYGNHDYGQYYKVHNLQEVYDNMARFGRIYKNLGWTLLCNQQRILVRGGDSIAVIGVENWGAEARFPKLADLVSAEKGTENVATKLLLSHDPTYWEQYITNRHPEVDVTFSGHTHGGQIGVETKGLKFSLVSLLHPFSAGLYSDTTATGGIQYLYVNRGDGTVGYFGRIGIPPEITLFIMHSGS
jgi:uncharacterized protein